MTYIEYLNDFNQWLETNALPVSSQLMYYKLLHVFNRADWREDVGVDNLRLRQMIGGASEKTAIQARDKLVEAGFITYKKGKKGYPNRYSLCKKHCKIYSINESINDSINASINASAKESINDSINASHIKTKTKKKNPPQPPRGVEEVSQPTYQPEWFERFWALYPRKTNRKQTVKTWDKLKPSLDLCRVMAAALRAQMGTEQWQDPKRIPHPSTWLNGERWNDEIPGRPPGGSMPGRRTGRLAVDENGEEVVVFE